MGYKELGALSHQEVRDMTREESEKDLKFAGFVIISCPFKPDTKYVVREILHASHHITMITGDNPLTACHVAAQLKLIDKKGAYVLSHNSDGQGDGQFSWFWQSIVDESIQKPLEFAFEKQNRSKPSASKIKDAILNNVHYFCLTGEVN